jgi:hypothetical protein
MWQLIQLFLVVALFFLLLIGAGMWITKVLRSHAFPKLVQHPDGGKLMSDHLPRHDTEDFVDR